MLYLVEANLFTSEVEELVIATAGVVDILVVVEDVSIVRVVSFVRGGEAVDIVIVIEVIVVVVIVDVVMVIVILVTVALDDVICGDVLAVVVVEFVEFVGLLVLA